jgi:putative oxygen-independent coproporphyrinogen III oxidase
MTADPIGVYVHVPYCRRICPYCDFNVHRASLAVEEDDVRAFGAELDTRAREPGWVDRVVDSVYFGGGTPSVFSARSIATVLERVAARFTMAGDAEVSLEANPGTVSVVTLGDLRAAGVTRLSIGAQSFDDATLGRLGRDHDGRAVHQAVDAARRAGFANVSLDLIYAVPGQSLASLDTDLATACALAPEHVSTYELTFEAGTPFARGRAAGRLRPVDDDLGAAMDALVGDALGAVGYRRYEISSHARPGFECRHNQHYWDGSSYLGVGPGAHSFLATPLPGRRWANVREPTAYRRRAIGGATTIDAEDPLTLERARADFVVTGLRRLAGVDATAFARRFGLALDRAFPQLLALEADALLERTPTGIRLTATGLRFADDVGVRLVA